MPPKPPAPKRRASIGFDTTDLAAFDGNLPFEEATNVSGVPISDKTEEIRSLNEQTSVDAQAFTDEMTSLRGRRIR